MKEQLLEFVIKILETEFEVDKKFILPSAMMKNELVISSLDFIKLITIIENQYNFEISDEILIMDGDLSIEYFCDKICEILTAGESR